ncbi:carbohydrate ABC transporter permease [Microbacterium sp. W4I20]|uniref:carbohydrate ABC transporter permease n=1 Tax=Microbacterium sp. W4I20 TaxID=3042262 RepID=UPI0027866D20|nr:sugar ABC transporter permease [Microbacterium sp. W4I20]MDQ0726712.1 raffinose/stachyose/melibiose transport system permease protein [Microbacterium sp. W4I20]
MTTNAATSARRRKSHRRQGTALLVAAFVGPALLLYITLLIWPLMSVGFDSVFEWTGSKRRDFLGLENYVELFNSERIRAEIAAAFGNNLTFFIGTMIVQNTAGLLLAVLIHRLVKVKLFFQTLISLPYLMNPLVVGYIWTILLNPTYGPVAFVFNSLGLTSWVFPWLSDPVLAMPLTILINAWQWVGFPMLLFGAAIAGIPEEIYSAASVDGASRWQQFVLITLPLISPIIGTITVLTFISCFNAFGLQLALGGINGGPGGVIDVLGLVFYRTAFGTDLNSVGLSSSLAVMTFLLIFGGALLLRRGLAAIEKRVL